MNESYPEPSEAQVLAWIGEHYGFEAKGSVAELDMAIAKRAAQWGFQQCAEEVAAETEGRWLDGETD